MKIVTVEFRIDVDTKKEAEALITKAIINGVWDHRIEEKWRICL